MIRSIHEMRKRNQRQHLSNPPIPEMCLSFSILPTPKVWQLSSILPSTTYQLLLLHLPIPKLAQLLLYREMGCRVDHLLMPAQASRLSITQREHQPSILKANHLSTNPEGHPSNLKANQTPRHPLTNPNLSCPSVNPRASPWLTKVSSHTPKANHPSAILKANHPLTLRTSPRAAIANPRVSPRVSHLTLKASRRVNHLILRVSHRLFSHHLIPKASHLILKVSHLILRASHPILKVSHPILRANNPILKVSRQPIILKVSRLSRQALSPFPILRAKQALNHILKASHLITLKAVPNPLFPVRAAIQCPRPKIHSPKPSSNPSPQRQHKVLLQPHRLRKCCVK